MEGADGPGGVGGIRSFWIENGLGGGRKRDFRRGRGATGGERGWQGRSLGFWEREELAVWGGIWAVEWAEMGRKPVKAAEPSDTFDEIANPSRQAEALVASRDALASPWTEYYR